MKAIETSYKGYRFRSRLEARWAVFFDALGIKWEYEKEGYRLWLELYPNEDRWDNYLPDFWLPGIGWIEVKGESPTSDEFAKCRALSKETNISVYIACGGIPVPSVDGFRLYHNTMKHFHAGGGLRDWDLHSTWLWNRDKNKPCITQIMESYKPDDVFGSGPNEDFHYNVKIDNAYKAARSARFEFGERGAR